LKLPPPDQLPAEMTDAQLRAVILHGIVNPSYPDEADEVLSYEILGAGHIKALVRDGEKKIEFEIDGDEVTYGLADGSPDGGSFAEATPDAIALFIERLAKKAKPQMGAMVETVRSLLDSSTDITEFNEKLQDAYPELDGEDLTATMAEALYASRLAGIFEAQADA
jgi:hypothetical protein